MKIDKFETKYSPEDFVWFMHENKPTQAMITKVRVVMQEDSDIDGSEIPNIFAKIKNFLHSHTRHIKITYTLDEIRNGRFYSAHGGWYDENKLFSTKEELLKSL